MCITKVAQPGNLLNVQFGNIDFFVFLQNQNKTVSTRGVSIMESRLYQLGRERIKDSASSPGVYFIKLEESASNFGHWSKMRQLYTLSTLFFNQYDVKCSAQSFDFVRSSKAVRCFDVTLLIWELINFDWRLILMEYWVFKD